VSPRVGACRELVLGRRVFARTFHYPDGPETVARLLEHRHVRRVDVGLARNAWPPRSFFRTAATAGSIGSNTKPSAGVSSRAIACYDAQELAWRRSPRRPTAPRARPGGRLRSHLKRDHVGGAELRAAESVLLQLVGWIADYNTQAPPRRPGTPAPGGVPGDSTQRAPICLTKWGTDLATSQPRRIGCSSRRRPRGRRDAPLDLVRPCTRLP
jgi:hypothetical protein